MSDDPRCCGSGACIINEDDYCWCGQKWDGRKMCFPALDNAAVIEQTITPDTKGDLA